MNFARDMNDDDLACLALDARALEAAKEAAAAVTALMPTKPKLDAFASRPISEEDALAVVRYRTYREAATAAWMHAAICALDMLRNQEPVQREPDQLYLNWMDCQELIQSATLEELRSAATDWEHFDWPLLCGAELTRIGKEHADMIREAREAREQGPQYGAH